MSNRDVIKSEQKPARSRRLLCPGCIGFAGDALEHFLREI